ncbi:hypothetical protein [Pantoea sp. Ep11b]|uniref:hypothetical protein n=1 Tax=unclassified Pantoea TaxID=2630326 RepID=UPI0034610464
MASTLWGLFLFLRKVKQTPVLKMDENDFIIKKERTDYLFRGTGGGGAISVERGDSG